MSKLTDICAHSIIKSLGYKPIGIQVMTHVRHVGDLIRMIMNRGFLNLLCETKCEQTYGINQDNSYSDGCLVRRESGAVLVTIRNRPGYIVSMSSAVDSQGAPFIERAILHKVFTDAEIAELTKSGIIGITHGILYQYVVKPDDDSRIRQYLAELSGKINNEVADHILDVYSQYYTHRPIKIGSQSRVKQMLRVVDPWCDITSSASRPDYVIDHDYGVVMTVFSDQEYICMADFAPDEIRDMIDRKIVDPRICPGYEFLCTEDCRLEIFREN